MDVVCTGSITVPTEKRLHKVLRPGYVLHAGEQCNDGRPITESWRYQQAQKQGNPIVCMKMKRPKVACPVVNQELWVDKYTPSTIAEIIGHKEPIQQLTQFLQAGRGGILIVGPPGIGKTTTVHVVARELGYKVVEHNASDTRSVSLLRGMIALGMKRLQKEVVIMDEVDGLSGGGERGGIGELADLIRKSNVPIICIANQLPPKLKPLQNACQVIKFHRPVKSTIATALLGIAKKEGITITKAELEGMCETSGNDIRSILNRLQFDGKVKHVGDKTTHVGNKTTHVGGEKDANLRMDLFSATQRLIGNKRLSLTEAEDLVYVDYGMVPLMVQEGYLGASRSSLEDAVIAAEEISFGDLINQRLWRTQDWSLLPHVVHSTVAAARTVQGPAPFQIFPQLLGKNSKRAKHRRLLEEVGRIRHQSVRSMRLYELEPMEKILLQPLQKEKPDIKGAIQRMDAIHLTRDHLVENMAENLFYPTEIPTKVKTAFTREYNKGHQGVRKVKGDPEDDLEDLDDLEEDMEELDL
jgi:replication factor C subunit 1